MDREVLTTVTFEENCEYQSSTISKKVSIPQQIVNIELSNVTNLESNRNGNYYYDDRIKLTAHVYQQYTNKDGVHTVDIKTGRVEFYFQPEGSTASQLLNPSTALSVTCELNQNGSTAIIFKPKTPGTVYAKYIDDNDFYTAITDTNPEGTSNREYLMLQEIPINITFTKNPPYLASVHDEVKLQVRVTNGLDGKNIKYGTVTFMHYLSYNDINNPEKRVPKVIGNPVPVINGYANITYIPVQSDDDTEPEILEENGNPRYVEYVRASYNYGGKYVDTDKNDYKWKYYSTSSKWTGINVLARNTITLGVSLPMNEDEESDIYQCSETDTITITATLKDKYNEDINFDLNKHSGTLTFHIVGTHAHPKKTHIPYLPASHEAYNFEHTDSEFEFLEYTKDITGTFVNGNDHDYFTATIKNLLPGFYTITATTTIQTNEGEQLINYGIYSVENDKKYEKMDDSNVIYIMSNYVDVAENYNIDLTHNTGYVKASTKIQNLRINVDGISNTQKSILNNQLCYFYVREVNKTYRGKLSYNATTQTLIGTPTEDIILTIPNNYTFYAYVPDGVYTNDFSVTEYHRDITTNNLGNVYDFYLPRIISVPIIMQVRENVELELSVKTTSNIRPATFSYDLVGKHVKDPVSVQIIAKSLSTSTTQVLDTVQLFSQLTNAKNTVTINNPDNYEIYAKSSDILSNTINVTVQKDTLVHEMLESSKNMFASVNNTMGIYLHCIDNNIDYMERSKLHFYVYNSSKGSPREITIKSLKKIDNNTAYVITQPSIGVAGTWYLQTKYDGNNYFKQYTSDLVKFQTTLDEPTITLIPYNYSYNVEITSPHAQQPNIIIAEVRFYKKNTFVNSGVIITDASGKGSFYDYIYNPNTLEWWNNWDNVKFTFKPYDTEMITLLQNNEMPYDALQKKYTYIFDAKGIADYNSLYLQLQNNNNEYIYTTYKPCEIKLSRPALL